MRKKLLETLEYDMYIYEVIIYQKFYQWIENKSIHSIHTQLLFTNQNLFQWFCLQIQHQEDQFLEEIDSYKHLGLEALRLYHAEATDVEQLKYYPKAIIHDTKKRAKKTAPFERYPDFEFSLN